MQNPYVRRKQKETRGEYRHFIADNQSILIHTLWLLNKQRALKPIGEGLPLTKIRKERG